MKLSNIEIKPTSSQEDSVIAHHFYQLWLDLDFTENYLDSDWQDKTFQYLDYARQNLQYQAFIAETEGKVVGSVGCQLFAGLYPLIFNEKSRRYGYIWGLYVEKQYRRRGIGKLLTNTAVDYLKSIDCTRVVLHASPQGKPVYESLNFVSSNQMHLDI